MRRLQDADVALPRGHRVLVSRLSPKQLAQGGVACRHLAVRAAVPRLQRRQALPHHLLRLRVLPQLDKRVLGKCACTYGHHRTTTVHNCWRATSIWEQENSACTALRWPSQGIVSSPQDPPWASSQEFTLSHTQQECTRPGMETHNLETTTNKPGTDGSYSADVDWTLKSRPTSKLLMQENRHFCRPNLSNK